MKTKQSAHKLLSTLLAVLPVMLLILTACSSKPSKDKDEEETETETEEEWNINGGDSDQPIMDGWTFEMAAEFYLTDELENDYSHVVRGEGDWLTPDSLARLTYGHVQVRIPIQQQDTKPRFGVTYRQPETGGTITFSGESCNNPTKYGDTLPAIGEATFHFDDDMYDYQTEPYTAYVQSRGKGFTFRIGLIDPHNTILGDLHVRLVKD